TVRTNVLGERDVQPTPAQLAQMRALVRQAMEEGALGVTTALIYSPNDYARTPELIALASESARCGGIYSVHMRSEGDRLIEAVQETVDIARTSGAPAEIYHLKAAGKRNWNKLDALIHEVQQARTAGIRITADMYVYTAGATGFDAAMPPWVQDGGLEAWIGRLKDRGFARGGGALPQVGRARAPRGRPAVGELRFGCGRPRARRRVPEIQSSPAHLRQLRPGAREVRARGTGAHAPGSDSQARRAAGGDAVARGSRPVEGGRFRGRRGV